MSNLQQFVFNDQSVRVLSIDGDPWFAATDVLNAIKSTTKVAALRALISDDLGDEFVNNTPMLDSIGRMQDTAIIHEAAVTFLVSRSRTETGKAFNRLLHAEILPTIRKTGSYSVSPQKAIAPFWWQRLLLDHKTNAVPNGYFSIFREVIPLVADLETAGYVLPDNAVPDISVGKHWMNYLKANSIAVQIKQYPHTYPDRRGTQPCYCFPESMLPMFRQWFREKYKVDHLQRYMKTKDKASLPAVDRIVKALMAG